ncbi:hypothetical protein BDV19DRAFT_369397 [Aspergillus venezuelensis]
MWMHTVTTRIAWIQGNMTFNLSLNGTDLGSAVIRELVLRLGNNTATNRGEHGRTRAAWLTPAPSAVQRRDAGAWELECLRRQQVDVLYSSAGGQSNYL